MQKNITKGIENAFKETFRIHIDFLVQFSVSKVKLFKEAITFIYLIIN